MGDKVKMIALDRCKKPRTQKLTLSKLDQEIAEDEFQTDGDESKIIPKIEGEAHSTQLMKEGEVYPGGWTVKDVKKFFEVNEMAETGLAISKLKMTGADILVLNKTSLALSIGVKESLKVLKLVVFLREIERGYKEKRKPKAQTPVLNTTPVLPPFKIPKRKLDPDELARQADKEMKRARFMADPDRYERELSKETPRLQMCQTFLAQRLAKTSPQNTGGFRDQNGRGRGGGRKICYNCQQEGHLGRECTNSNEGNKGSDSSSFSTDPQPVADDENWDDISSTSTTLAPTPKPSASIDDDWDDTSTSCTTPAITSKPISSMDDNWGDNQSTSSGRSSFGGTSGGYRGGRGGRGFGDRGGRGGGRGQPMVCFRCNEEGHISRECPQNTGGFRDQNGRGRGGGKKICYKCQQEGHLGRECTNSKEGNKGSDSSAFSTDPQPVADDENWDDISSTSTTLAPAPKPSASIDDDWGDTSTSCTTPATTPKPISSMDDNWGDNQSISSGTSSFGGTGGGYRGGSGGRGFGDRGGRGGGRGQPMICFRCNEEGHFSRECPQNTGGFRDQNGRGRGGGRKICYKCQQEGHLGRECTNSNEGNKGWDSSASSADPQPVADDENWDDTSSTSTTPAPTFKPTASIDDDWGETPTICTTPKPTTSNDDDWGQTSTICTTPATTSKPISSMDDNWGDNQSTSSERSSFGGTSGGYRGGRAGRGFGDRGGRGFGDRGGRGGGRGQPMVCFRCNEEGHFSRECPQNTGGFRDQNGRGRGGGKKICYKCQQEGHLGRECTNSNGNKGSDSSAFSTDPQPVADDENWDDISSTSTTLAPAPKPSASIDDDWGDTSTSCTTPAPTFKPTASIDDDWGDTSTSCTTPAPTFKPTASIDDDWGDTSTICTTPATTPKPISSMDDDWGDNQSTSSGRSSFGGTSDGYRGGRGGGDRRGRGFGERGGRGGGRGQPMVCFRCNEEGHFSRECPQNTGGFRDQNGRGRGGGKKICYKCQQEGHLGRECTNNNEGNKGWDSSASSAASQPVADDENWDDTSSTSTTLAPKSKQTASIDDDWGDTSTSCTKPATTSKPISSMVDDWGNNQPTSSGTSRFGGTGGGYRGGRGGRGFRDRGGRGGGCGQPMVCFRCNEEGHFSRECPQNTGGFRDQNGRGRGGGRKICYKCQQEGHLGRECTNSNEGNKGWDSSASSADPQPVADDENWDDTSSTSTTLVPTPKPSASIDDWDDASASCTTRHRRRLVEYKDLDDPFASSAPPTPKALPIVNDGENCDYNPVTTF